MVHYLPRGDTACAARLGLVVGRKLVKSAVGRNRIKRILREQFRQRRAGLPTVDVIFRLIAKPGRIDGRVIAAEAVELLGRLARRTMETP